MRTALLVKDAPQEPKTPAEWQDAVDQAYFWTLFDSARDYGLVTGGPKTINVDRCEEILARGREMGIEPTPDCVERIVANGKAEQ